ncbi:MAG: thioredoxin domain-containing protein, partial [Gammaproteobacteria bacterium]
MRSMTGVKTMKKRMMKRANPQKPIKINPIYRRPDQQAQKLALISLLIAVTLFLSSTHALENQLKNHPSPYLALHGDNPVAWQDWGEHVIKLAQEQNKLIFISSGYFSCHWCHVMQRESFSDAAIAHQLNEIAIPVKIDREIQPALDAWLIDFTERTVGQAGWPLNVFLTPQGHPLVGMTYLPPENFAETLRLLKDRWQNDPDYLVSAAKSAFETMRSKPRTHSDKIPDSQAVNTLLLQMIIHAFQIADDMDGGFGDQNKFPMSPQLIALLKAQAISSEPRLEHFLKLTLSRMATLGLRDHIGGGFYRYVVDPAWDTPHFEKMLYDNAQLTRVYLLAAKVFNAPHYTDIATDTLDFMLEVMQQPDGAFISSLSAVDDKDVEGGYYLWQSDELKQLLTETEYKIVSELWGTTGEPHLDGGHHLKYVNDIDSVAKDLGLPTEQVTQHVLSAIEKLHAKRSHRSIPKDDKILAAWNGLALTSLSQAVIQTGENRYRQAADKLFQFLATQLWDGKQLKRFIKNGRTGGRVSLEDYAYVAEGMYEWSITSGDQVAKKMAKTIALAGLKRFHNDHGWQLSESLLIPYQARELVLSDHTMASPSSTLLQTLLS